MRRLWWIFAGLSLACLWVGGSPAAAAEDVLQVVPENVLGVVVIGNVDQAEQRLDAVAERVGRELPDVVELAKQSVGLQDGLDTAGSVALAALMADGLRPALFVATGDFDALLKPLDPTARDDGLQEIQVGGRSLVAGHKSGFAILAPEKHAAAVKAVLNSDKPLAGSMAALRPWLGEKQVYAIVTPGGIAMAKAQVLQGIEQMKQAIRADQPEQAESLLAGFKFYELLFQRMDKELAYCAMGIEIEADGGVLLASRSLLADGGFLYAASQDVKPGTASPSGATMFPAGPFLIAGGGPMPQGLAKPMMNLSFQMIKMYPGGKELTEEQIRKLTEVSLKSMKDTQAMAMFMGIPDEGQPLYSGMLLAMKVRDSAAYLRDYRKILDEMSEIGAASNAPFLKYETEDIQVDGTPGLMLSMDMERLFGDQQIPQAEAMGKLMFGEDGKMEVYLAAADERTIVGSYVSRDGLEKALKLFREGGARFADDPGIATTTSMFPEGAQWIGYWSPSGMTEFMRRTIAAMAPEVPAEIPAFGDSPPVGLAVKVEPGVLETDLAVPPGVLEAGAEFVGNIAEQIQKAAAARNPQAEAP